MAASTAEETTAGVLVRAARPAEGRAVQMLLPEAFTERRSPRALVAVAPTGTLLGVVALSWRPWGDPIGRQVALRVPVPYRRRGVGRALIRAASVEARGMGARVLWAWRRLPPDAHEIGFLLATGFVAGKRFLRFEGDPIQLHRVVRRLRDAVLARGRLPAGARIVGLGEAPPREVAALYQRHLGEGAGLLQRVAGRGPKAFSPSHSVVLLVDGAVRGLVAYGWDGGVARIDGIVVDEAHRRSWAHVLLVDEALARGIANGGRVIRFGCWEDVRDTVKLAARAHARLTHVEVQYRLDLERP